MMRAHHQHVSHHCLAARWLLLAVVGVAAALAAVDAGFRELPRLDAPRDRPDDRWQ